MLSERVIRASGLVLVVAYAALIVWVYARQPQTIAQVTGGLASGIGAYKIDQRSFEDGLKFFRNDQFVEARSAFERADPAQRDARTQFYIAYSYYRQGWGRVYNDDELYAKGIEVADRAIALAPGGRLRVEDDPDLQMHSGEELKAELERGREVDASDFNPRRLFGKRK
jgi:tetratricopeptide (TPR) repeat protein